MQAGTLHCQSCGANVGENDLRCPFCNSQLATIACPKCLGIVSINATHCPKCGAEIHRHTEEQCNLVCPACKQKLFHTSVGDAHLDQCHACGGVWVEKPDFEKLAGDRAERGEVLGVLPGQAPKVAMKVEPVHYRPCPDCGKFMNRTNYAHISGVVLDVCKDHGLWFDRDKLRMVLEFIEAGGLERSRAKEIDDLREEHLHQAIVCPPQEPIGYGEASDFKQGGLIGLLINGIFKIFE